MENHITVEEYVKIRQAELKEFEKLWKEGEKTKNWPTDLSLGDWGEQELAASF